VARRNAANVEAFLKRGADPSRTMGHVSPLIFAVRASEHEIARLLLEAGANAGQCDFATGAPAIVLAALAGDAAMIQLLLDHGADIDGFGYTGMTALHVTAVQGCAEVARLLLAYGADPLKRDAAGATPAGWAWKCGHDEVLQLLDQARDRRGDCAGDEGTG
jgi:hypothetical protein